MVRSGNQILTKLAMSCSIIAKKDTPSEQEISKKPKHKLLLPPEKVDELLQYLRQTYPKCFTLPHSPLAIAIHRQLLEQESAKENSPLSKTLIAKILRIYTCHYKYKKSLIVGANRVNLDGTIASQVTENQIVIKKGKTQAKSNSKTEKLKPVDKQQADKDGKNTPHDALIKKVMENPVAAQEFLEEYLPESFKSMIDLTSVQVEKESFVENHLVKQLSDIILSVKTKNNEQAFIYTLIEAQVTSDHLIAFRLWKYMLLLCEQHLQKQEKAKGKNPKTDKLPLVCPLVLYHGAKKYTAPMNLWQLFTDPNEAKSLMANDYQLVDLHAMQDDEINYDKHLSIILYLMKHVHQRDKLKLIEDIFKRCHKAIIIDQKQDYIYTKLMIWYTNSKVPADRVQELEQLIVNNLPKKDTEEVMRTIADSYIEKGEAKGIEKGMLLGEARGEEKGIVKTALNMLKQGMDFKLITSITGIDTTRLQKLAVEHNLN